MKLRNKKTGEIAEPFGITCINGRTFVQFDDGKGTFKFEAHSLAELNEVWEDYEEPKEHWCITMYGGITRIKDDEEPIDDLKEIGNYFNSKDDAYDAWDKLKAWKRLKDKGIRVVGWDYSVNVDLNGCKFNDDDFIVGLSAGDIDEEDLNLLFGGEE